MALDPHVAALLQARAGAPALTSFPPAQARAMFEQVAAALHAASQPLPAVAEVTDRDADGLGVRVYRPEGGPGPRPTVVFLHGGGWVIGSVGSHDDHARRLCRDLSAVVVSVEYRLAPEHPFPAAPDDAWRALQWAVDHLDELGADPNRVAVAGDSAGGNLAAVVALQARDAGIPLAAQLLLYPATDLAGSYPSMAENAEGYLLTREDTVWFSRHYLGGDTARVGEPRVSPLRTPSLAGAAPAVVVTAEYDPIRDDGDAYAAALERAGVPVVHRRFPGLVHGFFGLGGVSPACERAVAWTVAEFGILLAAASAVRG